MQDQSTTAPIEYRDVVGFPGYRVGDDGSVWTSWHNVGRGSGGGKGARNEIGGPWRKMKTDLLPGSIRVLVSMTRGDKVYKRKVHQLVLEAFVGPRPAGMEGCHEDGNPGNNAKGNLRWGTHQSNQQDMVRHGRTRKGERNPQAKLNPEKVCKIREESAAGVRSHVQIAKDHGVCRQTVDDIASRRIWKHI
jgi:hypothetical protein